MNRRRNRRRNPPLILNHQTTTQILRQATSLFYSHLLAFLLLSTAVLVFRSNVHIATHYLPSLIDRAPSFKSILSRFDFSDHLPRRHRNRPSQHLSRAGTIDDDFFSGDSDFDSSLFHPAPRKPTPNATVVILSDFSPSIIKFGAFSFNVTFLEEEEEETQLVDTSSDYDDNAPTDLDFLIKSFELGDDHAAVDFLIKALELRNQESTSLSVLAAAYAYSLFVFVITYSWVSGVIFLKVVDHLLGNHRSFFRTFYEGLDISLPRLWFFILIKWAVRAALAQLMGIYFFGELEYQYVFFNVFMRIKFVPFSNLSPWVNGHEWESSGFIVIWFLIDLLVGLLFSVGSWVAIVNPRRGCRAIVRDGWRILVALFSPAFEIRLLEAIVCGSLGRWVLMGVLGEICTMLFQSVMEVYFMVAWLVLYFAARQMNDAALGKTFGRRELEGLRDIDRLLIFSIRKIIRCREDVYTL